MPETEASDRPDNAAAAGIAASCPAVAAAAVAAVPSRTLPWIDPLHAAGTRLEVVHKDPVHKQENYRHAAAVTEDDDMAAAAGASPDNTRHLQACLLDADSQHHRTGQSLVRQRLKLHQVLCLCHIARAKDHTEVYNRLQS